MTIHLNLKGQEISVYNPFDENITPIRFDPNGGEYDTSTVTVIGIVSGQSQGGWSGHDLYTQQMIKLESWKLKTDAGFTRSKLLIFRSVEKSRNYFKEIPPFSAVELKLFLNKDQKRAVMTSGHIILSPNDEITSESEFVKEVRSIIVDSIGELQFNHSMQNFQITYEWLGEQIEITINVNSAEEITDEIETLRKLIKEQKNISDQVMKYAVDNILKDRNENWIEPGQAIMNERTFRKYSKLESIYIEKNGEFSMDFAEDEIIFNGGFYMINSNIKNEIKSHEIGY